MSNPRVVLLVATERGPRMFKTAQRILFGLGIHETDAWVISIISDQLPSLAELDGISLVVISGSPYSVIDQHPWLLRASVFVESVIELNKTLIGICFGSQLIAQTLGGMVKRERPELCTVELHLTISAHSDPLLRGLGSAFRIQSGHEDTIIELPHQAIRLASTASVENHIFTLPGKRVYGIQGHPELSRASDFLRAIQDSKQCYRNRLLASNGERILDLQYKASDTPVAARMLSRVIDISDATCPKLVYGED